MAKYTCFLFCLVTLFLTVSAVRNVPTASSASPPKNYTRVCDATRFSELGLDMKDFAFCDSSLSYEVRVKDLIDRMTLLEKAQHISDTTSGIPRLGLPKYEWWSEALHGVANISQSGSRSCYFDATVPGATSFPTPVLTAASFNQSLWKTIGQAVSTEARAMYNLGHAGLTFWSPNINVVRDPRWGRTLETPGEDPYVVGSYATNYVRGLQDVDGTENSTDLNSRPLKVAACCKHYAAYDLDNWNGVERYRFDARVTEQDMEETFLRPFEMCVKEGDASSIMCSYNSINGIPSCADRKLLKDKIRGEWDLHGYIVSDCDSVEVMVHGQKWLHDLPEDAVSQALKAGLDLDCGNYYSNYASGAVVTGKVKESQMDKSLTNLYMVLMRLGFFDGQPQYESLGKEDICTEEHIELAAEAAREGIVLLQNNDATLPLDAQQIKTIAVVGPHANATNAMIGNYAGIPCRFTSPLEGLSAYAEVTYATGCVDVACRNDTLIFPAVKAAKEADATVIITGLDLTVESEGKDRLNLTLPGYQTQFINQVAMSAKGPVVLVIFSGGGVDISFAQNHPNIGSIMWAGYPGEEGGRAIADVIFGKYNPGGRLPLTWYHEDYVYMLPMTSMALRPVDSLGYPGRTYKFFNGSTVYPFGYGLSYTTFDYKLTSAQRSLNIELSKFHHCKNLNYSDQDFKPHCPSIHANDLETCDQHNLDFEVEVTNSGNYSGSDVVMVYWVPPKGVVEAPIKQLIAFQRVFLEAGESKKVGFPLNACKDLGLVNYQAYKLLASGSHTIMVGDEKVSFPVHVHLQHKRDE